MLLPIRRNKAQGSQHSDSLKHAGVITKINAPTDEGQRFLVA